MTKKPNFQKGRCRVCHHRADLHYGGRPGGSCQKQLGKGRCGCVGLSAGASGDVKKGGKRGSRYYPERDN